ncbi:(2Fe-2S)-binding protein [Candidatus Bipolaricaulota bacterium]|nr:(2Fe-2S)-binding protein [Candidatus Bipolaricaulota bacterium]
MKLLFELNGVPQYLDVEPGERLLRLLRRLGMKSVKEGCGTGDCGACTVLVDGRAVRSCLMVAPQVQGRRVLTLEGLGSVDDPHPLQQAFLDAGAVQCGFCTPGMILVAYELLQGNDDPSPEDVRKAIAGNLCRCTGYVKIADAVLLAARWKQEGKWR